MILDPEAEKASGSRAIFSVACDELEEIPMKIPRCLSLTLKSLIDVARRGVSFQDIMRDYKKFTCKLILRTIEENPQESRKEWMLK